jgi:hypothetical protein
MEWNTVTWYSKVIAVVLYVTTFFFAFYLGVEYSKAITVKNETYIPKHRSWKLEPGESIQLGNFTFTFNSVVSDSRCPIDVQCIQAGYIEASVEVDSNDGIANKTIKSTGEVINYSGYNISILNVKPDKKSGTKIESAKYQVEFLFVNQDSK